MTIRLNLPPEVRAGLLNQARQNGLSLEAFAEKVLREKSDKGAPEGDGDSYAQSIRRLATFGKRHGLSLGGVKLKDLLRESRP